MTFDEFPVFAWGVTVGRGFDKLAGRFDDEGGDAGGIAAVEDDLARGGGNEGVAAAIRVAGGVGAANEIGAAVEGTGSREEANACRALGSLVARGEDDVGGAAGEGREVFGEIEVEAGGEADSIGPDLQGGDLVAGSEAQLCLFCGSKVDLVVVPDLFALGGKQDAAVAPKGSVAADDACRDACPGATSFSLECGDGVGLLPLNKRVGDCHLVEAGSVDVLREDYPVRRARMDGLQFLQNPFDAFL